MPPTEQVVTERAGLATTEASLGEAECPLIDNVVYAMRKTLVIGCRVCSAARAATALRCGAFRALEHHIAASEKTTDGRFRWCVTRMLVCSSAQFSPSSQRFFDAVTNGQRRFIDVTVIIVCNHMRTSMRLNV